MSQAMQVGNQLIEYCKNNQAVEAINNLYSDNIVSVEAADGPGFPREMKGKEAILGKNNWWYENHEIHDAQVKGPFPNGDDRFAVLFNYDVTNKPSGQRMQMEEVALYTLEEGKIAREEFFYNMG